MIWTSLILESSDYDNNLWLVVCFCLFLIALKESILQILFWYNPHLLILEILILEFDYVSLKSHKIDKIIIKDTPSLSSIIQCKLVYYITIIDMKLTN